MSVSTSGVKSQGYVLVAMVHMIFYISVLLECPVMDMGHDISHDNDKQTLVGLVNGGPTVLVHYVMLKDFMV